MVQARLNLDPNGVFLINDQLSVKTVCQLTGINGHTLRAWERRYSVVTPKRLENGRRTYTVHDLEKLKLIALLVRKGFLIGNIAPYSVAQLNKLVSETAPTANMIEGQPNTLSRAEELGLKLEDAVARYDLIKLNPLLGQAKAEVGIRDYLFFVILPLLKRVGEAVYTQQLSVGQEHALSAVVRFHLMQSLFTLIDARVLLRESAPPKSFALATMEGNLHELGTLIAAVLCAYHGFPIFYLGAHMPAQGLADAARSVNANCIVLGLTPMPEHDTTITVYLEELLEGLPSACEVWTGGCPYYELPESSERIRPLKDLNELDQLLAHIKGSV